MGHPMNQKLKRHPDARTKILPDGHIVLQLKHADWVHVLTPTGAIVWEFADGNLEQNEIISAVLDIPELSEVPDLNSQIDKLISELSSIGLLVSEDYQSEFATANDDTCEKQWKPNKSGSKK